MLNGTDEKSLVERCRQGEDEAWRELVDAFGQLQALEAVPPNIAQVHPGGQRALGQGTRGLGDEHLAAVGGKGRAQEPMVLLEDATVGGRVKPLDEFGRTLDIGEQKCDGPGRKLLPRLTHGQAQADGQGVRA